MNRKLKPVVVLGAPGSGKQTLIDAFGERYDCGHISPGQAGREEDERGTDLGKTISAYQDAGIMIPLPLTYQLIEPRFRLIAERQPRSQVLFLDGFPRTVEQIPVCFQLIEQFDCEPLTVLYINTPHHVCFERLMAAKRGRKDDGDSQKAESRLQIYDEVTLPVIQFFERGDGKHRVHFEEVDGTDMINHAPQFVLDFSDIWGLTPRVA